MADVQSSFIPKQVLTSQARPRREPLGLFFALTLVVAVLSVLFFAGVYLYRSSLQSQIERDCPSVDPTAVEGCGLLASLEVRRRSLEQPLIVKIEQLDKQLEQAATLLNSHLGR